MSSRFARLAQSRLRTVIFGSTAATLLHSRTVGYAKGYKTTQIGDGKILKTNADFDKPIAIETSDMDWVASPIPNVERKRVFLHGTKEAGKVTSVVRYAPGSKFHKHPHPEGEEFIVLSGIFSDHSGDYGPGTYCLNPEGFEHAPSSKPGCEIVVRLRQHPNLEKDSGWFSWIFGSTKPRTHTVILPEQGAWISEPSWGSGVSRKILYQEPSNGYDDSTWLEKLNSGSKRSRKVPDGMAEEVFIMEGSVTPSFSNSKKKGTWIRYPAGSDADLSATSDTMLYVRQYPIDMIIGS